jgi:uncharacterized protein
MIEMFRGALPRALGCLLVAAALVTTLVVETSAQERVRRAPRESIDTIGARINSNTISIVSGNLNGTYLAIAYDLSAVLDDGDDLRILPVVGKGGGQNIRDVRFLKGVDVGITQSNLLSVFRRNNEIGSIDDKLHYIARLFNEEMHVVVRSDSGITSVDQLNGKIVNFSDIGSGTQLSTQDVFARLGIKATEVNMGQNDGFEALKRGEIAATILIAGKPTGSTAKLRSQDGFRLLPVGFTKALQDDYLPTVLTNEDYPGLIAPGQRVDTVAVGAVLIAYNWPKETDRYRRIAKFIDAFFPRIAEFHKPPRHPKWREVNLSATVPGVKRFAAATDWIERHNREIAQAQTQPQAQQAAVRRNFDNFLARSGSPSSANLSDGDREQLFQEFLKWSRQQAVR